MKNQKVNLNLDPILTFHSELQGITPWWFQSHATAYDEAPNEINGLVW